ncbi:hypothetical protein VP01_2364g1 [Puccinia sorghi]|uniref:Uncharacterized protein n=1 Tax=Puccinia sorghi TaxID=27349 RepID=A0A0L6V7B3_9BASI|nr:hypothetical protein VP01_2364g1 [Puccinia sorghi]
MRFGQFKFISHTFNSFKHNGLIYLSLNVINLPFLGKKIHSEIQVYTRAVSVALEHKCYHFNFLNNLLVELRMKLVATCVDVKLKNQPDILISPAKKSYTKFVHPIFLEIIFKFQKNLKNPYENSLHSPFYDLDIFFFYVLIVLKIKSLASEPPSIFQSIFITNKLHKTHTTLPTNKKLLANQNLSYVLIDSALQLSSQITWILLKWESWILNKALVWVSWWRSLEGQPNILCTPILYFSSSEDEPLLLPLSQKPVLKYFKATVVCFQHEIKPSFNQFKKDLLLNCRGYQLNLVPSSPRIRLNLCTTYNQHTTIISSVYDQLRKHLHASSMETFLGGWGLHYKYQFLFLLFFCDLIHFLICLGYIDEFLSDFKDYWVHCGLFLGVLWGLGAHWGGFGSFWGVCGGLIHWGGSLRVLGWVWWIIRVFLSGLLWMAGWLRGSVGVLGVLIGDIGWCRGFSDGSFGGFGGSFVCLGPNFPSNSCRLSQNWKSESQMGAGCRQYWRNDSQNGGLGVKPTVPGSCFSKPLFLALVISDLVVMKNLLKNKSDFLIHHFFSLDLIIEKTYNCWVFYIIGLFFWKKSCVIIWIFLINLGRFIFNLFYSLMCKITSAAPKTATKQLTSTMPNLISKHVR